MRRRSAYLATTTLALLIAGCPPSEPKQQSPDVDRQIFGESGEPMPKATEKERETFQAGEEVARRRFSPADGLGPPFNVTFCTSCHEQPVAGGSAPRYRNFFLTADRASDGSLTLLGKSGVQTQFSTTAPHRPRTHEKADLVATRNPIPFFGVGALAEIPEEEILRRSDPDDADGDGISGRPNWDRGFVGRFGRKAQTVSLEGFVRGPIFNHLGITTDPLPQKEKAELPVPSALSSEERDQLLGPPTGSPLGDFCPTCQAAAPEAPVTDEDGVEDPEMSQQDLFEIVSWVMLLAAPTPEEPTERTKRGEATFEEIGCADCHVPGLEGPDGLVMAYTDLLLHDMGDELADGLKQGVATGSEFRTQPLWGVAATEPYLHDGRADTLDEAIRWHGGEATDARKAYESLSESKQADLIAFLESLGGDERDTQGLLPPDSEPPPVGEYGGPSEPLEGEAAERYARGRRLFDEDITLEAGLGPEFNGDSCRACHFDPVLGGGGPAGVNVSREGHLSSSGGDFMAPPGGTLLHRFSTNFEKRPGAHADSNVFELRQPPPLFGLGLIDRIPESELAERADPEDADGDGVSGRIARPIDGRVGRFGWKAAFPTLEDFVRDALSNENGLTLPDREGVVAGKMSDADGVDDPEFAGRDYADLLFFSRKLGPPPRQKSSGPEIRQGRRVFGQARCNDCHTPTLETSDGTEVDLYSDLLLHDVAPEDFRGVAEADAGPREFRTPPLWGISKTAPYMHDGLAGTLDAAIRRHAGEASASTAAYEGLSEDDRRALIAFLESL